MAFEKLLASIAITLWIFATNGTEPVLAQDAGPFALHQGLQIKRAFTSQYGPDAEELNTITTVTPAGFGIAYADTRGTVAVRRVLSPDSLAARTYLIGFDRRVPTVVPGSTSLGISSAILLELRQTGQSRVALMHDVSLNTIDGILTLHRRNIKVPVLVENQIITVPAMHVKGVFKKGPRTGIGDFYFLDNKKRPLVLEYVIKFSWEKRPRTVRTIRVSAGRSQQAAMEQTLKTYRKLDLYGIHFDFNKATIRAETRGLISDIAKTLQVNPGWTFEIRGHTDSIGEPAYNVGLSQRRADAVKTRLVQRYRINPARLTASGAGATEPKATNSSLQGRAINRRVQLKRTDR